MQSIPDIQKQLNQQCYHNFQDNDISQQCICIVGLGFITQPITHICGRSFCKQCFLQCQQSSNRCPNCMQEVRQNEITDNSKNLMIRDYIDNQNVNCYYNNCNWKGQFKNLISHIKQCTFFSQQAQQINQNFDYPNEQDVQNDLNFYQQQQIMYQNRQQSQQMNPNIYQQQQQEINSQQLQPQFINNSQQYLVRIIQLQNKYEINPKWMGSINKLPQYNTVILCDDSGSMSGLADPDVGSTTTRWQEQIKILKIIIEAHAALNTTCDIFFINREGKLNVSSYEEVAHLFVNQPSGLTDIKKRLTEIWNLHVNSDMYKPLILHILTDGYPTDQYGYQDMNGFTQWLRNREMINKTFISIILCTDDEEIEQLYRPLEFNPGYPVLNFNICQVDGIQGVDVSEDYRGELRDVRNTRGYSYRFSFGDYVAKTLCGAIDPQIHLIDLPQNTCSCFIF